MTRYGWARWGDVNAFFGLMLDNVTVLALLLSLISSTPTAENPQQDPNRFTPEFVLTRMIPGTALGVLFGDLVYTWMAFRLARRTGRTDVTAMPLGLDTPSTFAVPFLVLLPVLGQEVERLKTDLAGEQAAFSAQHHEQAMVFAWHVGLMVLVLVGVFKVLCAPLGNALRRWVPRAGLLGSLAAIALTLIAFLPMLKDIVTLPVVGVVALTVILVSLVAQRPLPGRLPGALVALLLGLLVYGIGVALGQLPAPRGVGTHGLWHLPSLFPAVPEGAAWGDWWKDVFVAALKKLPVVLPFALATIVGGIDCVESAAAVGDEYDTRAVLLTEGLASVLAGMLGGVIQTTPYIGHPAYKAMGGRAAYTLATALFIGAAGCFGWFSLLEWLPAAALFGILVFVGLEITAQSFHATPARHYPALALAILPALACMAAILVKEALGPKAPLDQRADLVKLWCLSGGFIVTSLLWGSALAALLDGRLRLSAGYLGFAGLCALFGIIHSPFPAERIALPHEVWEQLRATFPGDLTVLSQSPFHWAAAYGASALLLLALSWWPAPKEPARDEASLAAHTR